MTALVLNEKYAHPTSDALSRLPSMSADRWTIKWPSCIEIQVRVFPKGWDPHPSAHSNSQCNSAITLTSFGFRSSPWSSGQDRLVLSRGACRQLSASFWASPAAVALLIPAMLSPKVYVDIVQVMILHG